MKRIILSNGLSLILQTMPAVNSVAVYVAVGAGSRYETKKTAGTAHFLEHMLFEGTKTWPSSKEVAEYIEKVGGRSSAWTDKECVTYFVKIPKQYLEQAFYYLAEILFNSKLEDKATEKEKNIIMEELKRKNDNPEVQIWDLWSEWVWGKNQSLGFSTLGDATTIQQVTQQQLQTYMKKFYHPASMAIAVVGNFSPSEAERYIRKYFGQKARHKTHLFKKVKFIPKKSHIKLIPTETQQSQLVLGLVTDISYHHQDRFSLKLISDILSGGVSSRLFHKLIYELGIAYSVGTYNSFYADAGLFHIYGGFSAEKTEEAVKTILQELKKLKEEKISGQELKEVKEKSKLNIIFSLETSDTIAGWYASQQITEKQVMTAEEYLRKIDKVTAEDIQRVAKQYFTVDNLYLALRGPIGENRQQYIENLTQTTINDK